MGKLQYGLTVGIFMTAMVILCLALAYVQYIAGEFSYSVGLVILALILVFGSIFGVNLLSKGESSFKK